MTEPRLSTDKSKRTSPSFPQGKTSQQSALHQNRGQKQDVLCQLSKGQSVGARIPALPHSRAEVGVYSSLAHCDPTSVTELCTTALHSSLRKCEDTKREKEESEKVNICYLTQSWDQTSRQPSLNEISCSIMRRDSRPLHRQCHGKLIPGGVWALRDCSKSHSDSPACVPWDFSRRPTTFTETVPGLTINKRCYIMYSFV